MYRHFDQNLKRHLSLCLLLLATLVLRLPSLCEPYWYGDEGIYLTLGTALRQGKLLYAEIVDHKTPLIYYLAMTPSMLWFRILMLVWMLVSTWAFYHLVKKMGWKPWQAIASSALFVALTNWPAFEGNIPNGELFVMGFILVGLVILSKTELWHHWFHPQRERSLSISIREVLLLTGAGLFGGLGLMTKVPALFDIAAMGWLGWLVASEHILSRKRILVTVRTVVLGWLPLIIGVFVPLLWFIVYYTVRGSFSDFLDFGLLYNFHYAGNWQLNLPYQWLAFFFTLPGKALVMVTVLGIVTLLSRVLSRSLSWSLGWLVLALFASLLSNRPYPHYFLQLVPPMVLTLMSLIRDSGLLVKKIGSATWWMRATGWLTGGAVLAIIPVVLLLLGTGLYPTVSYYGRWWKLVTGQISKEAYARSFNGILDDNSRAAETIRAAGSEEIFIWGTNPMLYALSQTSPTGRFTVSFHIKDINAYDETLRDLKAKHPKFVVVMNDEATSWPAINEYLATERYQPNSTFQHFILWKQP